MSPSLPKPLLVLLALYMHVHLHAQPGKEFRGKITDEAGAPLSLATIKVQTQDIIYYAGKDGSFTITLPAGATELTLVITHIGKETITRTFTGEALLQLQVMRMQSLSLKLPEVEVNGVRRKTSASNSSIVFDREAIEQTQALSVANVLNYLPGQTILKPGITVQSTSVLTLRTAVPLNSEQALNQAFGIAIMVDGNTLSNDANMQAMNPGRLGFFSGAQIEHPQHTSFIRDRAYRNGTLYSNYTGDAANNGLDLRQIPAENIESIEVISGVASARYGDYTNGVLNVERQAGLTPLRVSMRTNEGTQNIGINKGFSISPSLGVINISLDYLNSNDDPRNKIKAFQRVGGSILWTYQQQKAVRFRNTVSLDFNTTLDRTKRDPDDGREFISKFSNRTIRLSNRSEWVIKKPWLYNVSLQGSYSYGRQESYDQQYVNSNAVIGISNALETGINEGYYAPGYYLSTQQIIGEPVTAGARIEAHSIFKGNKIDYQLTVGANYSYSANKGPGVIVDPSRPAPDDGDKSDRPRPFDKVPAQSNAGVYIVNNFTTRLLGRVFNTDAGIRGDIQNRHFTLSPRINSNWKLSKNITWNVAYGIATKAPALSQISPGNVYVDIPLVNAYNGYAAESVYLVHTQVIQPNNPNLRPYRSYTFETGFNVDLKPVKLSLFYYNRVSNNGFATTSQILPVTVPNYTVTARPGQKPLYEPNGTYKIYHLTYNKISNDNYSRSNGLELMMSTSKIRALQTSFSASTSFNHSYFLNGASAVHFGSTGQSTVDTNKVSWYGVFKDQANKATTIKSTIVTTTHIPALRMAIMLSGELFWMNRLEYLYSDIYPVGYLNREGRYFPLTVEQAMSAEYAHLLKKPQSESVVYTPSMVYSNVSMRVSKEIGNLLRFSFNAYNVFNIRPEHTNSSGIQYYNGQPSFGAELIFTIK
ncbi:TonB-dependent receptor [Pseudoflavitalea sp. X16]|uniref:TonB-dependent receptor n=1 Tax=Paraflavitalea devenefica TaxID=2716334 RepID=UPI0014248C9D|nr:TonB-dependent receptor [Paraflavitalea devenefica]NII28095.1 TonB-dependent receptor [Paraflavitalea devenefica]